MTRTVIPARPVPEKLTSSASPQRVHDRASVAKLSLRQPRLAQAVEQMLGILGALEESQSPLRAVDRVLRVDPQHLGCLRPGLVELPQLREIGGQPDVA